MLPTFKQYYEEFTRLAYARPEISLIRLPNDGSIIKMGVDGPQLAIMGGVHGDEKSGSFALLEWMAEFNQFHRLDTCQLWILPLLNDDGWDADTREWHGHDLNRSFIWSETTPSLVLPIMESWQKNPPAMFLDLHEHADESNPERAYLFRYTNDKHTLAERMAHAIGAEIEDWSDFEPWTGSDETFLRLLGCTLCVTTEAPGLWTLEDRVLWNRKAIQWYVDEFFRLMA